MITAVAPLAVVVGERTTLRVLGLNLATARELVFPGTGLPPVPLKARKAAEIPKTLEMKEVGDLQFEAEIELPEDVPWGVLPVTVQSDVARSVPVMVPVRARSGTVNEREPNNGFTEANRLAEGQPVLGVIQAEKDVDVYAFDAKAGERFEVVLSASGRGSLLDGAVSVFDGDRRLLGASNGEPGGALVVKLQIARSGVHHVVVTDAADRGGTWCGYELLLRRLP